MDNEREMLNKFQELYLIIWLTQKDKTYMDFDSFKKQVINSYNQSPSEYPVIDEIYIEGKLEGIVKKWVTYRRNGELDLDKLIDKMSNFLNLWDYDVNG